MPKIDCSDSSKWCPLSPEQAAELADDLECGADTFGPLVDVLLFAGRVDFACLLAAGMNACAETAAGIRATLDDHERS